MDKKGLLDILRKEGFSDEIVNAFKKVPREKFIPFCPKFLVYRDGPLSIGKGQTISQPSTIAYMLENLRLSDSQKILEVGSGSGYVLALISELSKNSEIYGAERIKFLADKSRETLKNYKKIEIIHIDGINGLLDKAPFDRILVSAVSSGIPGKLVGQLKEDGRLVMPIDNYIISLKKTKKGNKIYKSPLGFRFVPLLSGKD